MTQFHTTRTVLIADDHPLVLQGLRKVLAREPDLRIVAACSNGTLALEFMRAIQPDIAVLDILMPGLTGLEVVSAARAERLRTKIVLLTAALGDRCELAAAAGGFEAIVLKESAPDELVDCIRAVVIGTARRSPSSSGARPAGHATATGASLRSACALTGRERAVVSGVVRALSNKQIARDLALSEGTIKVHLHNIYQKLHIQNRTELAIWAAAHMGDAD